MRYIRAIGLAVGLATTALVANAQAQGTSSVTIYGTFDEYFNYMHSSSGATIRSLEDGAYLRTRLGFRGIEDLGGGYSAKFQLEMGLNGDTGGPADTARAFDRQAWVGLAGPQGDFRIGRQNGPIFARGGYIDFTTRTLGSIVNVFGTPSRYDNDIAYISPKFSGFQFEGHVALAEVPNDTRPFIYQAALAYESTSYRLGYMGLRGRAASNAPVNEDVAYDNVYANWMYGRGTVYLAFVRSNNNTATAVSNNAGTILSNVGGTPNAGAGSFNPGTNPDLNNFYNIYQISADFMVTEQLKLGVLWGKIDDTSGRDRGATGGAIGAYYDLSKRTMLLFLVDTLRNDTNGGWRPAGSAGLKATFTAPGDINGRTINGVQAGIVHRF
jgi:predicted porin